MGQTTSLKTTLKTAKSTPKPSRKDALIAALGGRTAPTIVSLSEGLEIQPHSVRAAISGLRKAAHEIETVKSPSGGAATYRIAAKAASDTATKATS